MICKTGNIVVLFIASLLLTFKAHAQLEFSAYLDAGQNNVSEGLFLNTALSGTYFAGKFSIEGGYEAHIINPCSKIMGAGNLIVSGQFLTRNHFWLSAKAIYINNRFSEFVREVNWGAMLELQHTHFFLGAGTNFRTYSIPKDAYTSSEDIPGDKLHEYWNLMYIIGYNLKPVNSRWNLGIKLTNTDHFFISQETNPGFSLDAKYQFFNGLTAYTEAWLKRSGVFNLSVNHFGYLFRSGLIWYIDI